MPDPLNPQKSLLVPSSNNQEAQLQHPTKGNQCVMRKNTGMQHSFDAMTFSLYS